MPVVRIEPDNISVDSGLVTALADELRRGRSREASPHDAPNILEEVSLVGLMHVTVIWDAWGNVPREGRGHIIFDAYREVGGEEEVRSISIALGLTHTEADRLGISF